jgi:thiol-disulfide isomerase/thioredoxin
MRSKFLTLALLSGIAVMLPLVGCRSGMAVPPAKDAGSTAGDAVPAPEANSALPSLDGSNLSIAQYKGKVVLVNFWATWCQPCRIEIPWLIEFHQKYGPKGLVIVGVAMDDEGKKVVEPFVKNHQFDVNGHPETMNYQIVLGSDAISDKFGGLIGMPTSMLYSRDGKKIKTIIGLINYDDLTKALESQL